MHALHGTLVDGFRESDTVGVDDDRLRVSFTLHMHSFSHNLRCISQESSSSVRMNDSPCTMWRADFLYRVGRISRNTHISHMHGTILAAH